MVIDLSTIGTDPKALDVRFKPSEIGLEGEIITAAGDVLVKGDIRREGERAVLEAAISAEMSMPCSRCLEAITRKFEIDFRDVFTETRSNDKGETELADEQLDESVAEDGRIDLSEVVREQLLLATPEQVFCREDCKGLCQKCGANLNLIDCKCADDEVDPRWAALKNLK